MKCSIPEKNTQKISVCYIKISIFRKLISLVHFVYSSSVPWIYDFIHQNIQQNSSTNQVSNNFNILPTPRKITQEKEEGEDKDGPVLSFITIY